MSSRQSTFKQRDVKAAIKAATDAGLSVKQVKANSQTGEVVIELDTGLPPATPDNLSRERADWDKAVAERPLSGK